jgi:CRP/FNR family cyclic AMP-dependent transcriptional regulator
VGVCGRERRIPEGDHLFPSEEKVRLLARAEVFEPLSFKEIEELSWRLPDAAFEPGEVLYSPEQPSRMLFILREGRVRVYRVFRGRELTLAVVRPGQIFGEIALTRRHEHEAYAQAMTASEVSVMSWEDLRQLIREHPEVGMKLADLVCRKLRLQEGRMVDIAFKEVPGRLASIILYLAEEEGVETREGEILIPALYTHEQLASMIGSKRVAVTRAFKLLREEGAVELRRRMIYITNRQTLQLMASP